MFNRLYAMKDSTLFLVIVASLGCGVLAYWFWQRWRYRQFVLGPFPQNWLSTVEKRLPIYKKLPEDLQKELQQHIKHFLFHKRFVGCAGLVVNEEMRLAIAANACLLLLNRPTLNYQNVRWIYVYPAEFVVRHSVKDAAGVVSEKKGLLAGEAWSNGRVILSWNDVDKSVKDFNDGYNVVLHEFAHQLDNESGSTNGAPLLSSKGAYGTWATIMTREFNGLREHAYFGKESVLNTYGATNPAEFFAVATESFFEEPKELKKQYPELFAELESYYQVDPIKWH